MITDKMLAAMTPSIKRNLDSQPFGTSLVDVIIPFHGQYEKTARLVTSLLYGTYTTRFAIRLVDDASPNELFTDAFINPQKPEAWNLKIIRSDTQLGFGGACKLGYDDSNFPWCLFIHSDCVIEDVNWLLHLGQSLLKLKSSGVKLIVPLTDNPGVDNPLLKAEKGEIREDVIVETGFLPLYCFLVHRDLFKHIGGFIKQYPYGGYEDEELAHRMRKYGYKQAICGSSWVHHDGASTIESLCKTSVDVRRIIDNNYNLCLEDIKKLAPRQ